MAVTVKILLCLMECEGLTQGKGEENDEALQKYLSAEKEVNVRERNSKQFCLVLLGIG